MTMTFTDYQHQATNTAIYPEAGTGSVIARAYLGLKLAGESGEVSEKLGKLMRDKGGAMGQEDRVEIAKELGDVLWYVSQVCREISVPMEQVARMNLAKLADRAERGVLSGSGDNR